MRQAQYSIPRAGRDQEDGMVAVFHFPGSGGTADGFIRRWISQFSTADGGPLDPQTVHRETFEVNGLTVHFIELTGYQTVSTMMGGTGRRSETQFRLLGSIVETPGGPWFFKGTGPDATMAAAKDGFLEMIKSIRQ